LQGATPKAILAFGVRKTPAEIAPSFASYGLRSAEQGREADRRLT
jgi:hypothetical protein